CSSYGLLSLPGIGPYTAAAVASIAFGEPVAVVDGNVRRVLARLFAVERPSARWLRETAQNLLDPRDPGMWNQALMELGALVCTPKSPGCGGCPVAAFCQGRAEARRYPAKEKRRPQEVEAVALVLRGRRGYLLERRDGQALAGLWGFPLAEGENALEKLLSRYGVARADYLGTVVHTFTHKKLTVHVYGAAWNGESMDPSTCPISVLDQKILSLAERVIGQELGHRAIFPHDGTRGFAHNPGCG
ncbi:MAG: NUDIX domain-containing protein, partial [Candidatus Bipolaricaulaceae bacterium]